MGRSSHNLAEKPSRESDTNGANTPSGSQLARKCLSVVPKKEIASACRVEVRTVQKWASGEISIPEKHIGKIQKQTLCYFMSDLHSIERAITQELIFNYGPNAKENF